MKWYEKYPEEFREVLSKVFRNNFFDDYNDKQYILTDHGVSVTIEVLENSLSIIELEGDKSFLYLKNKKCADKVIIQKESEEVYNMHIFEFSKSRKKNDELIEQLEGACLRAIAVLSYFKIVPEGGNYQLQFTDEDFVEFFSDYIKAKTEEVIFSK